MGVHPVYLGSLKNLEDELGRKVLMCSKGNKKPRSLKRNTAQEILHIHGVLVRPARGLGPRLRQHIAFEIAMGYS